MAFPILAFVFGLLFYALASALVALTSAAPASSLWWLALLPLALCHGVAGFLAMATAAGRLDYPRTVLLCALVSAATTFAALAVASTAAVAVPLPLSPDTAAAIVWASLLAGAVGLVGALRVSQRSLARLRLEARAEK